LPTLPHKIIEQRLQQAVSAVLPGADLSIVLLRPCPDPKFGDYQANALMQLARPRKADPRQLATEVVAKLDVNNLCEPVEIAGPGFLNFRLKQTTIEESLQMALKGEHLFFQKAEIPRTIVVDFSSPNVAKPMHVGHIRSTILGDSIARTLRLLGHKVITDNHLGDWGTQFGMLLTAWKTLLDRSALERDPLAEMERIYKLISAQCDPDKPGFNQEILNRARSELVKLQGGDSENLEIWRKMIRLSQSQFDAIYGRLGIKFDYTLGESFYNAKLPGIVADLMRLGIAKESRGAKAVFSDGSVPPKEDPFLVNKDGEWIDNPFIIQKQDGGFNYGTTDLATIAHRLEAWQAQEIAYVTDGRQQLHFRQLFATFSRWHRDGEVKLAHIWFGSILGEDKKPFKTRSGETIRLAELLDEAEERALAVVAEKNPDLPASQQKEIARVIGIGAVKYADLLSNRQSDYIFSWAKLLSLNGNTAPYLQYAYARIRSIFRKAAEAGVANESVWRSAEIKLPAPEELNLARHLMNFGVVLDAVVAEYRPNYLCNYLYELAGWFTSFYENCPVLKSVERERASRLALCALTASVLKQGLDVLGIETLEQM
jgi:arginyl-tRNA synthetase